MTHSNKKITFFDLNRGIGDKYEVEVKAAGVLMYKFNYCTNQIELLMYCTNSRGCEDLGGKVDIGDQDITLTAAREAYEESNCLLNQAKLMNRIVKTRDYVYIPKCKYLVFMIEANNDEIEIPDEEYGEYELHDSIKRTIRWIPFDEYMSKEFIKNKLHIRLKHRDVFHALCNINELQMFYVWS